MGQAAVVGKKFYVHLAGTTNRAHLSLVAKLKGLGYMQVDSSQQSSFILVFCPVASRVGTDISEAVGSMPGDKPVILVVMHHTFNCEHVVADSSRQVNHPNVCLTVDCLFYEGVLLKSNHNDSAWFEIQKILGVSQVSTNKIFNRLRNHPWRTVLVLFCAGILARFLWLRWGSG